MPEWARETVIKAINGGYIRMDETGAMNVAAGELPNLVRMDRAGLLDKPAESWERGYIDEGKDS